MPAPQNRATRRAPTKRAPAKTAKTDREKAIEAFDEYRQRAAKLGIVTKTTREPVVLGKEQGFDPPIVARWPESLADRTLLDIASDAGNVGTVLRVLLGDEQLLRVAMTFDAEPDADELLLGLMMHIWGRMLGPGAGDVPGGTPASST